MKIKYDKKVINYYAKKWSTKPYSDIRENMLLDQFVFGECHDSKYLKLFEKRDRELNKIKKGKKFDSKFNKLLYG